MLYIRVDGNADIGTGHMMRCLSIAQAAKQQGRLCTFIVADHEMTWLLEQRDFPYICLDSVWNDLDQETDKMEELIRWEHIRLLLVDSYFVTPDYLRRLNRVTHVAYMDDLDQFHYPCSTLINYNIYAHDWDYPSRYPGTRLLLGPQYAPLRREFQNSPLRCVQKDVRFVLVTTGGSDPLNVAGQFAERAVQRPLFSAVTFHIVVGRFNPHLPMLERLAAACSHIKLHCNIQHMSELMYACDAAVSAAGTTLYELCACGVPTVVYALADNQLSGAAAAAGRGLVLYAGDVRENSAFAEVLCDKLAGLMNDYPLRKRMTEEMRHTVDGNGAMRLTDALISDIIPNCSREV